MMENKNNICRYVGLLTEMECFTASRDLVEVFNKKIKLKNVTRRFDVSIIKGEKC